MNLRGLYLFDELGIPEPRTSVRKKVPRFFMPISQSFGKISHLWDLSKRKNKIEEMKKIKNHTFINGYCYFICFMYI